MRGVRCAFVDDLGRAVRERPVDHVGVAGHPAHVGGAPVDVGVGLEVEHGPVRVRRADEVAAGRVQDALGLAGRPGGVHDVERVLGVVHLGLVLGGRPVDHVVPPHVAGFVPLDVLAGTPDHQDLVDLLALLLGLPDRLVDGRLERRRGAAPVAAVRGDDHLRLAVGHPVGERVGGEAAEDDGVRRADPGAGQHRDHGLGDHRQVDRDPVTLGDAELGERVGGLADLVLEVGVRQVAGVVLGLADPVQGDLVAVAVLDVPVDAVVRRVDGAAGEPLGERRVVPVQDPVPLLAPVQALGLLGPERLPVGGGAFVGLLLHVGVLRQLCRRLEPAILAGEVGQGLVSHRVAPVVSCCRAVVLFLEPTARERVRTTLPEEGRPDVNGCSISRERLPPTPHP